MRWSLDIGVASVAKNGEELCGDVVEINKGKDSLIVVLSDGLGSGVKANILGTLTGKIASHMLMRGVALEEVVRTMAETLPVCQVREIAYSTFTIIQFYEHGQAYIAQFDNPPLLLVRNGEIRELPCRQKVIDQRQIQEAEVALQEEDILIMVSDGVTHAGIGGLLPLGLGQEGLVRILQNKVDLTVDSQGIADQVLEYCLAYSACQPGDDITVVVMKLRRPIKGVLFSGPPLAKESDSQVVQEFIKMNSRKAICGGTTANIVARETGRILKIAPVYEDMSLPPCASLEGVDLVTEGVLTLTRVVELLETGDHDYRRKKDGASLLLKWLLNCDEVEMLVGLQVNLAHLESGLSFELGLRTSLLQRLKEILTARGKNISIKWF